MTLVPCDCRDPRLTTSRGVGELIKAALDTGARHILIGCGDSGVNNGDVGLIQALGARLLDRNGQNIPGCGLGLDQLDRIDLSSLDRYADIIERDVGCDVGLLPGLRRNIAKCHAGTPLSSLRPLR